MGNILLAVKSCNPKRRNSIVRRRLSSERWSIRISSETDTNKIARRVSRYGLPMDVKTKLIDKMKMTDDQIQKVKEAFARYDKTEDGKILTRSFINVMRSLGENPTEDDTSDMLYRAGHHGSGFIDFASFLEMWSSYVSDIDWTIKEAFVLFDNDGSGAISLDEFRKVMISEGACMTDEEIDEVIREVDVDGDGQMNINEFVAMLRS